MSFTPNSLFFRAFDRRPRPYPLTADPSRPFCPLSRYRPELRTCSAIERIRPADGKRPPSAYPAAFTAFLKKDWLPPPFTFLPASFDFHLFPSWKPGKLHFPLLGSAFRLIRPFRSLTGNRRVSLPGTERYPTPSTLLQAPPCGIPGYSLLSGGRLFACGGSFALVRVLPARHCIFCLLAFRGRLAPAPQGTHAGYPRRFSPMRAFQQLPLPKAVVSRNGFHPAYAPSCRMVWRNPLSCLKLSISAAFPAIRRDGHCLFPSGKHRLPRNAAPVIKPVVEYPPDGAGPFAPWTGSRRHNCPAPGKSAPAPRKNTA